MAIKLGIENRKQAIAAAIMVPIALGGLIYLGTQIFGGSSAPPAPQPAVVTTKATPTSNAATTANGKTVAKRSYANSGAQNETSPYDPTLHPEVMFAAEHLTYTGSGRNIFSASSAPVMVAKIEKPIAPARPMMAMPTAPTGPPPPPPIPLTLFGVAIHRDGTRQVFLKHSDDVFMASVGDIVMRQYKVTKINATSVELEDLPHNNRQTLNQQN